MTEDAASCIWHGNHHYLVQNDGCARVQERLKDPITLLFLIIPTAPALSFFDEVSSYIFIKITVRGDGKVKADPRLFI